MASPRIAKVQLLEALKRRTGVVRTIKEIRRDGQELVRSPRD